MTDNGWRERVLAMVEEAERRRASPRKSAHITYPLVDHSWLKEAAARRGMGLGTYARAAMYAFAAHDLGLDVDDLLKFLPRYDVDTGQLIGGGNGRRDSKPTRGQWGIVGLTGHDYGKGAPDDGA